MCVYIYIYIYIYIVVRTIAPYARCVVSRCAALRAVSRAVGTRQAKWKHVTVHHERISRRARKSKRVGTPGSLLMGNAQAGSLCGGAAESVRDAEPSLA